MKLSMSHATRVRGSRFVQMLQTALRPSMRPPKLTKEKTAQIISLYNKGIRTSEILRKTKVTQAQCRYAIEKAQKEKSRHDSNHDEMR